MFRIILFMCVAPVAFSIIVKDPPAPNEYNYSYDVKDPSTGDTKSQREVRTGDVVRGAYTVLDPDGTKRTVEYSADPTNGFTAVVHKESGGVVTSELLPIRSQKLTKKKDDDSSGEKQNDGYSFQYEFIPSQAIHAVPSYSLSEKYSHSPYYAQPNYEDRSSKSYFTPANEITSDEHPYSSDHYFSPSSQYYY